MMSVEMDSAGQGCESVRFGGIEFLECPVLKPRCVGIVRSCRWAVCDAALCAMPSSAQVSGHRWEVGADIVGQDLLDDGAAGGEPGDRVAQDLDVVVLGLVVTGLDVSNARVVVDDGVEIAGPDPTAGGKYSWLCRCGLGSRCGSCRLVGVRRSDRRRRQWMRASFLMSAWTRSPGPASRSVGWIRP